MCFVHESELCEIVDQPRYLYLSVALARQNISSRCLYKTLIRFVHFPWPGCSLKILHIKKKYEVNNEICFYFYVIQPYCFNEERNSWLLLFGAFLHILTIIRISLSCKDHILLLKLNSMKCPSLTGYFNSLY